LDHGALEFGKYTHHLKHCPPRRHAGVEALLVEIEVHLLGVQLLQRGEQVGKWIERRRDPARYRYREPPGIIGGLIYVALLVGVPVLIVIWGFATGRLPAR
jgi:hypothetical protein